MLRALAAAVALLALGSRAMADTSGPLAVRAVQAVRQHSPS